MKKVSFNALQDVRRICYQSLSEMAKGCEVVTIQESLACDAHMQFGRIPATPAYARQQIIFLSKPELFKGEFRESLQPAPVGVLCPMGFLAHIREDAVCVCACLKSVSNQWLAENQNLACL